MHCSHKRVLIVGTVPYNEMSTSRAFDSYFHFWEKENLAQIFSNAKIPVKGHCATLYQITDDRMLRRHFSKNVNTGVIFNYDDLPNEWADSTLEVGEGTAKAYKIGSRKNSLIYLLRKLVWKKEYWCTKELLNWLDSFAPECVFLSFSDDFFIPSIALFVAERYSIPIVSSIGDDYYFNYKHTLSPLYHIYKLSYRRLIRKVLDHDGSAIYIGDKIRDKYNNEFGLNGETVYLTSSIARREFKQINREDPVISYFGNIRLGRNESLVDIADSLRSMNLNYKLHVYSNENEVSYYQMLVNHPNIFYHGSVPYDEVQRKTVESDILVVVEGFKRKHVDISRYSLSTKVADSLSSGVPILAYGSAECGAIEYAISTGSIITCTSKEQLSNELADLIFNVDLQKSIYNRAIEVTENNHRLNQSTAIFQDLVDRVCGEYNNA